MEKHRSYSRREFMFLLAGAVSLTALPLSACAEMSGDKKLVLGSPTIYPPAISLSGILRVGVSAGYVPFAGTSNTQDGTKLIGIDVDVAAAMADYMGLKLELVDITDRNAADLFLNGEVDLVMGNQRDDPEHSPYVMVGPYLHDGPAVFCKGLHAPAGGFDLSSLNGQTIAARSSSLAGYLAEKRFGAELVSLYADIVEVFDALDSGAVSYAVADAIVGGFRSGKYRDVLCLGFFEQPRKVFIAVEPGNQDLTDMTTKALRELRDKGALRVIANKWLGYSTTDLIMSAGLEGLPVDIGDDLPDPDNANNGGAEE
jgi:polar amino acid transport system substrate-binding protein